VEKKYYARQDLKAGPDHASQALAGEAGVVGQATVADGYPGGN